MIFIGVNALGLQRGTPDCRPEFIARGFQNDGTFGNERRAVGSGPSWKFHTPLIDWTKGPDHREGFTASRGLFEHVVHATIPSIFRWP